MEREKRGRRKLSGSGNNSLELGVCVGVFAKKAKNDKLVRRQRRLFYFVNLTFFVSQFSSPRFQIMRREFFSFSNFIYI